MNCWKCGQTLAAGSSICPYCDADQNRPAPTSEAGKALRTLYDRYGAKSVLDNGAYLSSGLGDLVGDSQKLRNQLKMAMDSGVGRLYLEQLETGAPDADFDARVKTILTEEAALSDRAAEELAGYFDEMIGWRSAKTATPPTPKPAPEDKTPGRKTKWLGFGWLKKLRRKKTLPGEREMPAAGETKKRGLKRFLPPLIVLAVLLVGAPKMYVMQNPDNSVWFLSLCCAAVLGLTLLLGRRKGTRVVFAVLFGLLAAYLTGMFLYFGLSYKSTSVPFILACAAASIAVGIWMALSAAKAAEELSQKRSNK